MFARVILPCTSNEHCCPPVTEDSSHADKIPPTREPGEHTSVFVTICTRVQTVPLPLYPNAHAPQCHDPGVLMQAACGAQSPWFVAHCSGQHTVTVCVTEKRTSSMSWHSRPSEQQSDKTQDSHTTISCPASYAISRQHNLVASAVFRSDAHRSAV